MPKDRDWIDYANLASQVGQNIQLNQLRRGLEETGAQEERGKQLRPHDEIFQGVQRLKTTIRRNGSAGSPRPKPRFVRISAVALFSRPCLDAAVAHAARQMDAFYLS